FAAPLDDAYTTGRLAALNAVSDVFAVAGRPTAALAHVTIPVGPSTKQEQLLFELLSGAKREFDSSNTSIVGGHTIEGPQLAIGFTVLGQLSRDGGRMKGGLREGDLLVLTKPLGSGVLLAANMQAQCRALWMKSLLDSMLMSNQHAAALIAECDVSGVTDVTGFGFAGHLLEMLGASDLRAEVDLANVPLLPGAAELIESGVESTLAPANRAAEREIEVGESLRQIPAYAALFDPQTSGGLLLGVRPDRAETLMSRLQDVQPIGGTVVGRIVPVRGNARRILIK
ncbi:MAG: selenide, water dikinase SelD, partial [Pirellulales bacterium]|nr:selenide, water dikinase SelD [Pirellulales bacterium]